MPLAFNSSNTFIIILLKIENALLIMQNCIIKRANKSRYHLCLPIQLSASGVKQHLLAITCAHGRTYFVFLRFNLRLRDVFLPSNAPPHTNRRLSVPFQSEYFFLSLPVWELKHISYSLSRSYRYFNKMQINYTSSLTS